VASLFFLAQWSDGKDIFAAVLAHKLLPQNEGLSKA